MQHRHSAVVCFKLADQHTLKAAAATPDLHDRGGICRGLWAAMLGAQRARKHLKLEHLHGALQDGLPFRNMLQLVEQSSLSDNLRSHACSAED